MHTWVVYVVGRGDGRHGAAMACNSFPGDVRRPSLFPFKDCDDDITLRNGDANDRLTGCFRSRPPKNRIRSWLATVAGMTLIIPRPRSSFSGGSLTSSQSHLISLLWEYLHFSTTFCLQPVLGFDSQATLYPTSRRCPPLRPRSSRRRLSFRPIPRSAIGATNDVASLHPLSDYARSQQCCSIIQTRQTDYR